MKNALKVEDVKRLNAIVDGASELPRENQEYILAAIKAMIFTKDFLVKQMQRESTDSTKLTQEKLI